MARITEENIDVAVVIQVGEQGFLAGGCFFESAAGGCIGKLADRCVEVEPVLL